MDDNGRKLVQDFFDSLDIKQLPTITGDLTKIQLQVVHHMARVDPQDDSSELIPQIKICSFKNVKSTYLAFDDATGLTAPQGDFTAEVPFGEYLCAAYRGNGDIILSIRNVPIHISFPLLTQVVDKARGDGTLTIYDRAIFEVQDETDRLELSDDQRNKSKDLFSQFPWIGRLVASRGHINGTDYTFFKVEALEGYEWSQLQDDILHMENELFQIIPDSYCMFYGINNMPPLEFKSVEYGFVDNIEEFLKSTNPEL